MRAPRREGPVREGVRAARSRASPASTTPTRSRPRPSSWSTPRSTAPEECAPLVVAKLEELGLVPAAGARRERVVDDAERLITPHGGTLVDRTGDRPDGVEPLEQVDADLARAVRPGHARERRALAARGLHGPERLRARRRGDAPRERAAVGAARLPRGRRGADGRPGRARRRAPASRSPSSRSTRSTSTTRSARPSAASARPTRRIPGVARLYAPEAALPRRHA